MKNCALSILLLVVFAFSSQAQKTGQPVKKQTETNSPKLIVGIVIDQMRWDYLYRFNPLFKSNGGFKRLMTEGFSCDNTFIPYTPTVTAVGHASVYTGTVPNIHGIVGNGWYDNLQKKTVYCVEDKSANSVGTSNSNGQMSPRNMFANTITDELRMASNFTSKVIGISLKDRGAILPAGHAANAAYWYDTKTGKFISSTYYMNELPDWVDSFNERNLVDSFYNLNWSASLSSEIYDKYCTGDIKIYESQPFGKDQSGFPYDLTRYVGKDYGKIATTPYGNSIALEMAKSAIVSEKLGSGKSTDFLAVSFSSPDYIGHAFGPNSWEQLDDYVRMDEHLGSLFEFLDTHVGKNQYTVFLTADHGVAHIPGFLKENGMPGGAFGMDVSKLNDALKDKFGRENIIAKEENYQLYLNHSVIDASDIDKKDVTNWLIDYVQKMEGVSQVFELSKLMQTPMNAEVRNRIANGYHPARSGDIQYILKPGYVEGGNTGTSHGLWNPYDSHIPLLWYGWGIKHGSTFTETKMTDIAATVAALLHIQMPNGCVGHVIEEVLK